MCFSQEWYAVLYTNFPLLPTRHFSENDSDFYEDSYDDDDEME